MLHVALKKLSDFFGNVSFAKERDWLFRTVCFVFSMAVSFFIIFGICLKIHHDGLSFDHFTNRGKSCCDRVCDVFFGLDFDQFSSKKTFRRDNHFEDFKLPQEAFTPFFGGHFFSDSYLREIEGLASAIFPSNVDIVVEEISSKDSIVKVELNYRELTRQDMVHMLQKFEKSVDGKFNGKVKLIGDNVSCINGFEIKKFRPRNFFKKANLLVDFFAFAAFSIFALLIFFVLRFRKIGGIFVACVSFLKAALVFCVTFFVFLKSFNGILVKDGRTADSVFLEGNFNFVFIACFLIFICFYSIYSSYIIFSNIGKVKFKDGSFLNSLKKAGLDIFDLLKRIVKNFICFILIYFAFSFFINFCDFLKYEFTNNLSISGFTHCDLFVKVVSLVKMAGFFGLVFVLILLCRFRRNFLVNFAFSFLTFVFSMFALLFFVPNLNLVLYPNAVLYIFTAMMVSFILYMVIFRRDFFKLQISSNVVAIRYMDSAIQFSCKSLFKSAVAFVLFGFSLIGIYSVLKCKTVQIFWFLENCLLLVVVVFIDIFLSTFFITQAWWRLKLK